jgi:hypothetical protein
LILDGKIVRPGLRLGGTLYVLADRHEWPAVEQLGGDRVRYPSVPAHVGQNLVGSILEWPVAHLGGAELVAGFVAAAIYGDATAWRSHLFICAKPGAGKSRLLELIRAALGGAAHELLMSYTRALMEQRYLRQACAIIGDEAESENDPGKLRSITELIRLLSGQQGAKGGRGSAAGDARALDLRGAVCLAATVKGPWKQQDRTRITVIELTKLRDENREAAKADEISALIERAKRDSPLLRARMLGRWELFQQNLRLAKERILVLGGSLRDSDQLGHLLAGWWTLTCDHPADEAMLDDVGDSLVGL